ncbi:hypothetical protein BC937DRAFT_90661 [Endogone sp. FLAS-F59071]|nr:hypothetical protein BC937DRAFT_90661 [Endogone sp. FLAS-F59071]|eukprot:RUS16911.1 hypothetical protein BC937DRAFT_90661 [Endogone sp. FLAS-F59071]
MDPTLRKVAEELTKHLNVKTASEEPNITHSFVPLAKQLSNIIEALISSASQINESRELLDETQAISQGVQPTLVALQSGADKLDDLFEKIDHLEEFVNLMKNNINEVAERIDEMERAIAKPTNTLTSFILTTSSRSQDSVQPYFPPPRPVEIFRTSDFFPSAAAETEAVVAGSSRDSR